MAVCIKGYLIDDQVNSLINSLVLVPDWKERIIGRISTVAERESIISQRKHFEGKLKRLAKTYIDGLIDESNYNVN